MARVAVIGAGSWGTSVSWLLGGKRHEVALWSREPEIAEAVKAQHRNPMFMTDVLLPESVTASSDIERVLSTDDLVAGRDVFFAATGITDGSLLRGVKYWPDGVTTYSMVMRSRSGTVRIIEAEHRFAKLEMFSPIEYRR